MKKRMTNIQLVKDIMENSRYGAMAQLFVMDALFKFSDLVAESTAKDYERKPGERMTLGVSPDAWIGVAKEIQQKLKGDQ